MDDDARPLLLIFIRGYAHVLAHGRGLLQLAAVFQRRAGRASDHAPPGSHAVRDPPSFRRAALAGENGVPAFTRRYGGLAHPSRLPLRGAAPRELRSLSAVLRR